MVIAVLLLVGAFMLVSHTNSELMPSMDEGAFTISATLKVMASSNSRRSSPVSFLIFSKRYTKVFRWTKSLRAVSDTFRLFSKNLGFFAASGRR